MWQYEEAERHLRSLELFGMRFGLDRMRRLMTALESPIEQFRALQVVGTNGKSSTARAIAAILQRHGLRTGAYLSPDLGSLAERIEICEQPLPEAVFAAAVQKAARAAELVDRNLPDGERVTQFELLTAAAYWQLAASEVGVAVVEAGLGGRYDATSVIEPDVLVLTNVGLEHTRWLGPTERHIAEEKLAVMPAAGTVVTGSLGEEAAAVAERLVRERGALLVRAGREFALEDEQADLFTVRTERQRYDSIALRPLGRFQHENFALAVASAEEWLDKSQGAVLDPDAVRTAARELVIPGRLEPVGDHPLVLFDGAHNPDGAAALGASLEQAVRGRTLIGVISILDDKNAAGILSSLLPHFERVVFTRSTHQRALPPATLDSLARQLEGPPSEIAAEPRAALECARELAGGDGAVLVTGSIYLLSDLVRAQRERSSDVSRRAR